MNMSDSLFYSNSDNVNELMGILEEGIGRSSGQDPTIGAIRRLADLQEKKAVPLLRQAINHTNVTVKTDAALALYYLGESGGLDALISFLSNDKSVVSAIRALAKTKDEKAISSLQNLKTSGSGRSCIFNGDMTSLGRIVDIVLNEVMPNKFPLKASSNSNSSSKAKGGCFIATAVYGSYEADQVRVLRKYRDEYLLNSAFGYDFVELYYAVSPYIAKFIVNNKQIKSVIKKGILDPFVRRLIKADNYNKNK